MKNKKKLGNLIFLYHKILKVNVILPQLPIQLPKKKNEALLNVKTIQSLAEQLNNQLYYMVSNSKYLTKKKNAPTTSMPTLPDYLGVSEIQNDSPCLPYGISNPPDMRESTQSTFFTLILANFEHLQGNIF